MTQLFEKITANYRMRFYSGQKKRFRNFIADEFKQMGYDNVGIDRSKNVIVGDIDNADVVYSAHYDTPPFSAYITPFARLFGGVAGQIVSVFAILGVAVGLGFLLDFLVPQMDWFDGTYLSFMAMLLIPMCFPNPNNANDNGSGVLAVCELARKLKGQDCGKNIAYVLFNNEEWGLLGSAALRSDFKKRQGKLPEFVVCNLDCVGLGTDISIHYRSEKTMEIVSKIEGEAVKNGKISHDKISTRKASPLMASDHMNFKNGMAIFAMSRSLCRAFYIPKLHMPYDKTVEFETISTVCDLALEIAIGN